MQLLIFRSIGKFVVDWLAVGSNILKSLQVSGVGCCKGETLHCHRITESIHCTSSTSGHSSPRSTARCHWCVKCPVCLERDCCRDAVYTSGVPRMRSPHRTTITSARALSGEPVNIRPFFIIFIEETISVFPFFCLLCYNQPLIISPSTKYLFL